MEEGNWYQQWFCSSDERRWIFEQYFNAFLYDPEKWIADLHANLKNMWVTDRFSYGLNLSIGFSNCGNNHIKIDVLVNEANPMQHFRKNKHHVHDNLWYFFFHNTGLYFSSVSCKTTVWSWRQNSRFIMPCVHNGLYATIPWPVLPYRTMM